MRPVIGFPRNQPLLAGGFVACGGIALRRGISDVPLPLDAVQALAMSGDIEPAADNRA